VECSPGRFELDRSRTVRLTPDGRCSSERPVFYDNRITQRYPHAYKSCASVCGFVTRGSRRTGVYLEWSHGAHAGLHAAIRADGQRITFCIALGITALALSTAMARCCVICTAGATRGPAAHILTKRGRRLLPEPLRYAHKHLPGDARFSSVTSISLAMPQQLAWYGAGAFGVQEHCSAWLSSNARPAIGNIWSPALKRRQDRRTPERSGA
jgi:hypothetical protein